jgi:hypothetical protein
VNKNKKVEKVKEKFAMALESMMLSPEWRALSSTAKIIYFYLKLKWNPYDESKPVSLTYAELDDMFTHTTISRGFKELEAKDWIEVVRRGGKPKRGEREKRECSLYLLTGAYDAQVRGQRYRNETQMMKRVKPIADQRKREEKRKETTSD